MTTKRHYLPRNHHFQIVALCGHFGPVLLLLLCPLFLCLFIGFVPLWCNILSFCNCHFVSDAALVYSLMLPLFEGFMPFCQRSFSLRGKCSMLGLRSIFVWPPVFILWPISYGSDIKHLLYYVSTYMFCQVHKSINSHWTTFGQCIGYSHKAKSLFILKKLNKSIRVWKCASWTSGVKKKNTMEDTRQD